MFIDILLNQKCTVYTKKQTGNKREYDETPTHTNIDCALVPNTDVIESGYADDPALAAYKLYTREQIAKTEDLIVIDNKHYIVKGEVINRQGAFGQHAKYLLNINYDTTL